MHRFLWTPPDSRVYIELRTWGAADHESGPEVDEALLFGSEPDIPLEELFGSDESKMKLL